jgi:hypothetical protein
VEEGAFFVRSPIKCVMRRLDPRICRVKEDGRGKHGHDVWMKVKLDQRRSLE